MKFRPDIEGLRAIAIGTVVLYHAFNQALPGGFIGVDVFFVISGFLISRVILEDLSAGTFSYASFYTRRIRRIFPALFFMLAVVSIAASIILSPSALNEFGNSLGPAATFFANWHFYRTSGYFDTAAEWKPLVHTWSLAVEEQFYIVFPILLIAARKWFGNRLFAVLLCCGLASLAMSVVFVAYRPSAAFYLGPPRAFELLIGSLLALDRLPKLQDRRARELVAAAGIAMIGASAVWFDRSTPFPGFSVLLPCLGAAAIIYAGQAGSSLVAQGLSLGPVRYLGAISYSLYLWHWPLLVLGRHYALGELTGAESISLEILAIVMAAVSLRFVERPFRCSANRNRPIFGPALATVLIAVTAGSVLTLGAGFPGRFSAESQRLFRYQQDISARRTDCHGSDARPIPYARNCVLGDASAVPSIAIWGDSFGVELAAATGAAVGRGRSVMQITYSSCPPSLGINPKGASGCADHNRQTLTNLVRDARIKIVVIAAKYNAYASADRGYRSGFERATLELSKAGKQLAIVYPAPEFSADVPEALGMTVARGHPPEAFGIAHERYLIANAKVFPMLDAIAEKAGAHKVLIDRALCNERFCAAYAGDDALFFDRFHLSGAGARLVAPMITSSIGVNR